MPIRYARKLNKFNKLDLHSIGLIMKRFYEMAIKSFGLFHSNSLKSRYLSYVFHVLPTKVLIPPWTRFSSLTKKVTSKPSGDEFGPRLVSIRTPTLLKQPRFSRRARISCDFSTTCSKSCAWNNSFTLRITKSSFVRPKPSTWTRSTWA